MGHFELFKDKRGEYRFRLRARNGEIIAVGEGYTAKAGCLNGIDSVKRNASTADIKDLIKGTVIEGAKVSTEPTEEKEEAVEEKVKESPTDDEVEEEDDKQQIIAGVSAVVGGVIGYLIAVTVNPLIGALLAIIVGALIGIMAGLKIAKDSDKKNLIAAVAGLVGVGLSYLVAMNVPVSMGNVLAVIIGALFGLLVGLEKMSK